MVSRFLLALFLVALVEHDCAAASRRVICLSGEGWTCDGVAVSVPHTWNALDGTDGPDGDQPPKAWSGDSAASFSYVRKRVTYRRNLPAPTSGKRRVFVKCEGASVRAEVFVNGMRIGQHTGAFTSFACEATSAMKESQNVLEIEVDNRYDECQQPMSADFTDYGGLYRDVWLIETDPICIDPVTDGADGVLVMADAKTGNVEVKVSALGGTNETQRFSVANPVLWAPEAPVLYTRTICIDQSGSHDEIPISFGFRTVGFKADGFYLNGERLRLNGVNRHQDRQGKGWAIARADEEEDIAAIKEIGANALRTAHYPQSQHVYDLCDRNGLVCWVEYPNVNRVTCNDEFERRMCREYREMIAQLRNHPSVCMWGLFNEMCCRGNGRSREMTHDILSRLNAFVHRQDPSRPTVAAMDRFNFPELNALPDQLAFNRYPGWYHKMSMREMLDECFEKTGRSTLGISEYGVGASVIQHGEPTAAVEATERWHPEEYQAYRMGENVRQILEDERVWGSFVWAMFDFGSDRRTEGERDGINDKGIVSYDRKTKKDAYYLLKANWSSEPVLHLVGSRMTEMTNSTISVMAVSNIGDVSLKVNGMVFATKSPNKSKFVIWENVPMSRGDNVIEVHSGCEYKKAVWKNVSLLGKNNIAQGENCCQGL